MCVCALRPRASSGQMRPLTCHLPLILAYHSSTLAQLVTYPLYINHNSNLLASPSQAVSSRYMTTEARGQLGEMMLQSGACMWSVCPLLRPSLLTPCPPSPLPVVVPACLHAALQNATHEIPREQSSGISPTQ